MVHFTSYLQTGQICNVNDWSVIGTIKQANRHILKFKKKTEVSTDDSLVKYIYGIPKIWPNQNYLQ